jgi:hypothetical protein
MLETSEMVAAQCPLLSIYKPHIGKQQNISMIHCCWWAKSIILFDFLGKSKDLVGF